MQQPNNEITHLLNDWREGNDEAMNKLMDAVYGQLKIMAHRYTIKEKSDNTLNTTGLVHEAFLRIVDQDNRAYQNRSHFYAILATCMRRVILEVVRSRNTSKRGSGAQNLELEDQLVIAPNDVEQILMVNDALEKLESFDPKLSKIVEYRYFGGLRLEEIAEAMECSLSTLKRDWRLAKTWLHNEFNDR